MVSRYHPRPATATAPSHSENNKLLKYNDRESLHKANEIIALKCLLSVGNPFFLSNVTHAVGDPFCLSNATHVV